MIIQDKNIKERISKLKIFLFDLDGVIVLRKDHNESEIINCMTEFTEKLKDAGYYAGVITARNNDNLTEKLTLLDNCRVVTSAFNKVKSANKVLEELELNFDHVLYIGDDMLDIPLLQKAGISVAPSSARREVKRSVDFVIDITNDGSILHTIIKLIERLKNE
jgi:YrbI family 3-deoxy-D-manno-octulosonate 8-phosphate phosphatase